MPDDPTNVTFDDSGAQAEQSFVARKQQDSDAALAQAYLAAHPEAGAKYGIQQVSTEPPAKVAQPAADMPPATEGAQPDGSYKGTDLFGNPVTLNPQQRAEASSGAVTGSLDTATAKAHPVLNKIDQLLPLIGLAVGVGKLGMNLAGAAGVEGAEAAGAGGAGTPPIDIEGKSSSSPNLPNTSEHFQTLANHPDATPELKSAVQSLKPAIRDPETGEVYLANNPNAKNHFEVFGDLPDEVAKKESLDSGFVGADNEYMTRQQAADHLIAAQVRGGTTAGAAEGASAGAGAAGAEGTAPQLPEEHATPMAAAQTLAQKQVEALKTMKIGTRVAEELDHPELATTIPEAETIAKGRAQGLTMAHLGGQQLSEPELASASAALTDTVHAETMDLRTQALDIMQRRAAGEDVTADQQAWMNRVSALAPQAARVSGMRTARRPRPANPRPAQTGKSPHSGGQSVRAGSWRRADAR